MEIRYNVTGARRKELVKVISDATGVKAVYRFMPTCNFEIGCFTVNKEGTLIFADQADKEEVKRVLDAIAAAGFADEQQTEAEHPAEETEKTAEMVETADSTEVMEASDSEETAENDEAVVTEHPAAQDESLGMTVEIPLDKVAAGNLTKLLDAKGNLIKKALGVSDLRIEILEDRVAFPWFSEMLDTDAVQAYTHFISALCEMSRNAKRVTVIEKTVDNEKYAFRCFLLRLGFIGAEYKTERKILLKNLTGSSAFKNGGKSHEVSE